MVDISLRISRMSEISRGNRWTLAKSRKHRTSHATARCFVAGLLISSCLRVLASTAESGAPIYGLYPPGINRYVVTLQWDGMPWRYGYPADRDPRTVVLTPEDRKADERLIHQIAIEIVQSYGGEVAGEFLHGFGLLMTPAQAQHMARAPDRRILSIGLDDTQRVPGHWIVVLKESLPWHRNLDDLSKGVEVTDPKAIEENRAAMRAAAQPDRQMTQEIAKELAATYGGIIGNDGLGNLHMFTISIEDDRVKLLARDSRIGHIEADTVVCVDGCQHTPPLYVAPNKTP
jgi:hypothetical protein